MKAEAFWSPSYWLLTGTRLVGKRITSRRNNQEREEEADQFGVPEAYTLGWGDLFEKNQTKLCI